MDFPQSGKPLDQGWALESLELTHEIANLYGQKLLTVTLNIQLNCYNL